MLKSLADLPSDLGLEAVEKFGMASLETVRSKTGFMARPLALLLQDSRACSGADMSWSSLQLLQRAASMRCQKRTPAVGGVCWGGGTETVPRGS